MENITVKEYIELTESERFKFDFIYGHINEYKKQLINIEPMTYNDVKIILKEVLNQHPDIEKLFNMVFKTKKEKLLKMPLHIYFGKKKYIASFFISLLNNESKLLRSINVEEGKWLKAGGERLNEFSDVLPLSQLAKIYGGYPLDYGNKPYLEIIYLLRMNSVQNQVENEYQKGK